MVIRIPACSIIIGSLFLVDVCCSINRPSSDDSFKSWSKSLHFWFVAVKSKRHVKQSVRVSYLSVAMKSYDKCLYHGTQRVAPCPIFSIGSTGGKNRFQTSRPSSTLACVFL